MNKILKNKKKIKFLKFFMARLAFQISNLDLAFKFSLKNLLFLATCF